MPRLKMAAIYKCETQSNQNTSIQDRKDALQQAVETAYEAMRSRGMELGLDLGDRTWGLFAAPEYTFCYPCGGMDHDWGDNRHLSEGDKVGIENWIKTLSANHPKMILFPGSVAWKKSFDRGTVATYLNHKGLPSTKAGIDSLELPEKLKVLQMKRNFAGKRARTDKAKDAIARHANVFLGGAMDHPVAGDKGPYRADTDQEKIDEIDTGVSTSMARNTCYVYLNGKRRLKYNKQQDFHEVLDGNTAVYIPGMYDPIVDIEGVTYGVEICLDHIYSTLGTVGSKVPDVFVLMSAMVSLDLANVPLTAGGWAFHACSDPTECEARKNGVVDGTVEQQWALAPDLDLYSYLTP